MKNPTIYSIGLVILMLATSITSVRASDVKVLSMSNPANSNGIQMGDVLNRTFAVEVDSVYQLPKTSLPMKGDARNGIELCDINVQTTKHGNKNLYTITLSYQVFTSAAKPEVMALPEEHLALIGGSKPLSIDIPVWRFWYSPLVAQGITNAKENLQPQAKPALIDLKLHHIRLWISLSLLMTGLLGLVYVNADKRWLPFMNGAFAQAHRNIKKLKNGQASSKNAFTHVHQAFNKIYGANLFATDLDEFFVTHPRFLKLGGEIRKFFELSNRALFDSQQSDETNHLQELIILSKRLRDCERGV